MMLTHADWLNKNSDLKRENTNKYLGSAFNKSDEEVANIKIGRDSQI